MGEGPGAILSFKTFLSFINRLLVTIYHPDEDQQEGTLSAPFWCLCQRLSLSPLYFNTTLLHKSSERSSLVSGPRLNSSPPGAKNPGVFAWFNNNLSMTSKDKGTLQTTTGEGNSTHSSVLAWKIPWMEEPGGLQSMGSLRVGHDWATSLSFFTFMHWRRKWKVVVESREYTGILGPQRRRIQSGARDEAWSLRAFV